MVQDFDADGSLFHWACGIAFNEVRNFLSVPRRSRLHFDVELVELMAREAAEEESLSESRLDALRLCLRELSEQWHHRGDRTPVVAKSFQGERHGRVDPGDRRVVDAAIRLRPARTGRSTEQDNTVNASADRAATREMDRESGLCLAAIAIAPRWDTQRWHDQADIRSRRTMAAFSFRCEFSR